MSFNSWLKLQIDRKDIVGDLANDILEDSSWPKRRKVLLPYMKYMVHHGYCDLAKETLMQAWDEFKVSETT